MKSNLRTVSLLADGRLSIFEGWYVTVSTTSVFLQSLGNIPRKKANLKNSDHSPYYLLSATLIEEVVDKEISSPSEDDIFFQPKTEKVKIIKVEPQPDENFYYCFLLDDDEDISFSSKFKVFKDVLFESHEASDKYHRIVYASLPYDVPLVIDSRKTICISPF